MLVQISRECTPSYLFTGISNLLQPAQTEAVLGQLSTYFASWLTTAVPAALKILQSRYHLRGGGAGSMGGRGRGAVRGAGGRGRQVEYKKEPKGNLAPGFAAILLAIPPAISYRALVKNSLDHIVI
jgi:hypothetical protein